MGLVADGKTIRQMALELRCSSTTVRHWLRRYELRTAAGKARAEARSANAASTEAVIRDCRHHGETEFVLEGRGYYRCRKCRSEGVAEHRRRLKQALVAEAGGQCALCGYARCVSALHFHHLDPAEKRLQFSWNGLTVSKEAARAEARKCVLLCANCHAEVEAGVSQVPLEFLQPSGSI